MQDTSRNHHDAEAAATRQDEASHRIARAIASTNGMTAATADAVLREVTELDPEYRVAYVTDDNIEVPTEMGTPWTIFDAMGDIGWITVSP